MVSTTKLSLFFCIVAAALVAALPAGTTCARSYVVQDGDVCDAISQSNAVSTYQLASANVNVIDSQCSNLLVGETICLALAGQDCTSVVVVQAQDTCSSIVNAANIDSDVFYANNPQIDSNCGNLYINEVVCTANTVITSGTPVVVDWLASEATATTSAPAPMITYYSPEDAQAAGLNFDNLPECY